MASRDLIFRFIGIDAGAGREFDKMAGKASMLGGGMAKLAIGVGAAAGVFVAASVKMATDFQKNMELVHTQAGASQAEVQRMSKAVLGLAGQTATAPEELAKGLYHLESSGLRGAKALEALKTAAQGAKVGGADLESVTNALNAVIASGIPGAQNMQQAMGALNATVGAGDMRMQDLADALGTGVLASMKGFGLSLNDVGAALAVFGDNNIRGADAATQLRMAVMFMAKPAATAGDSLKTIGLSAKSLSQDLTSGGLTKALGDLQSHMTQAGITGGKVGQFLTDAFGHKAGVGLSVLISQFSRYQQKTEEVAHGAKNFGEAWKSTTETLSFKLAALRTGAEAFAIKVGTVLIPVLTKTVGALLAFGKAAGDVFGWMGRHKVAILAVAGAITGFMLPALVRMGAALAVNLWETFALKTLYAKDAIVQFVTRLTGMNAAGTAAGAALTGVTAGIALFGWAMFSASQKANQLKQQIAHIYDPSTAKSMDDLTAGFKTAQQVLQDAIDSAHHTAHTSLNPFKFLPAGFEVPKLKSQLKDLREEQTRVTDNVGRLSNAFGVNRTAAMALAQASGADLTGSFEAARNKMHEYEITTANATGPQRDLKAAQDVLNGSFRDAAQDVDAYTKTLEVLIGGPLAEKDAWIAFQEALNGLKNTMGNSTHVLDENSTASIENRKALDAAASAIVNQESAWSKNGRTVEWMQPKLQAMKQQLYNQALAVFHNKAAVDTYLRSLNLLPSQKTTTVKLNGAEKATAQAKSIADQIRAIPGSKTIVLTVTNQTSDTAVRNAGQGGRRVAMAEGGPVVGGIIGRDSVPAMLMPGEFVVRRDGSNLAQAEAMHGQRSGSGTVRLHPFDLDALVSGLAEANSRQQIVTDRSRLDRRGGRAVMAAL